MENFEIIVPQAGELYQHYKGGIYRIIRVGRLSNKRCKIMVVYESLDRGHTWIRPLGEWSEYVEYSLPDPYQIGAQSFVLQRAQRFTRYLGGQPPQKGFAEAADHADARIEAAERGKFKGP